MIKNGGNEMKKMLSLLMSMALILSLIGCGIVGGKSHPSELVGKYKGGPGMSGAYIWLEQDGDFSWSWFGLKWGTWWVDNQIIYFEMRDGEKYQYDLRIAKEDIEYEIDHNYTDLSPSEKSSAKLNFKFRFKDDIFFKEK